MFFDDILDKNPDVALTSQVLGKVLLKNAVVFKIDKEVFDDSYKYWKSGENICNKEFDYARTPYESLFFQFGRDRGCWIIGEKVRDIYYSISIMIFDPVLDEFTNHYHCVQSDWTDVPPELITYNLIPRLSAVTFDLQNKKTLFPCIAGRKLTNDTNLEEYCKELLVRHSFMNLFVVIRILTIINCINVGRVKQVPNEKIQSVRRKRGKLPLVSYYTLEIKTNSDRHESENRNLWTNRIHIQRGHFKQYTEGNPLFGKHVGLWWWQPSVRGRNKDGIIYKDYEMKGTMSG